LLPITLNTLGNIPSNEWHKKHSEAIMSVPQIFTYRVVENGIEHKEEQKLA